MLNVGSQKDGVMYLVVLANHIPRLRIYTSIVFHINHVSKVAYDHV
jgi:hypothetical protein